MRVPGVEVSTRVSLSLFSAFRPICWQSNIFFFFLESQKSCIQHTAALYYGRSQSISSLPLFLGNSISGISTESPGCLTGILHLDRPRNRISISPAKLSKVCSDFDCLTGTWFLSSKPFNHCNLRTGKYVEVKRSTGCLSSLLWSSLCSKTQTP